MKKLLKLHLEWKRAEANHKNPRTLLPDVSLKMNLEYFHCESKKKKFCSTHWFYPQIVLFYKNIILNVFKIWVLFKSVKILEKLSNICPIFHFSYYKIWGIITKLKRFAWGGEIIITKLRTFCFRWQCSSSLEKLSSHSFPINSS